MLLVKFQTAIGFQIGFTASELRAAHVYINMQKRKHQQVKNSKKYNNIRATSWPKELKGRGC